MAGKRQSGARSSKPRALRRKAPKTDLPKVRPRENAASPLAMASLDADDVALSPSIPTVVGVGASAGGLEAFSQLLEALPADSNVAIVFVQHLSPQHESALPLLLSSRTQVPIVQVT